MSNHKKGIFLSAITLYILITSSSTLYAAAKYYLYENGTRNKIACEQLKLTGDSFECSNGGVLYIYPTDMISTCKLNNTTLYPFDRTVILNDDVLSNKDCKYIIEHLPGPLLLEKSAEAFLFAGTLYEHGQCVTKNTNRALSYYKKAGNCGKDRYMALREKLIKEQEKNGPVKKTAGASDEFIRSLQQSADIKRVKHEMQKKVCKSECNQKYSTHNKYRIEAQCFADCMEVNGY